MFGRLTGARTVHHAQKGFQMSSLHTDLTHDLGTLMAQVIDRLAAEIDGAIARSAEMVPRESEEEASAANRWQKPRT